MRNLPKLVTKLCYTCEAWIAGSAAQVDKSDPKDYDVLVPFQYWVNAAALIPGDAQPNTFGGWKIIEDGIAVDVWPGDLSWYLLNEMARSAWHPRSNTRITKT